VLRLAASSALAFALSLAPYQCGHAPDPDVRREDTAGDALWSFAADLRARHDDHGADEALRFLVAKYPSSRHAEAARAALSGSAPAQIGAEAADAAP